MQTANIAKLLRRCWSLLLLLAKMMLYTHIFFKVCWCFFLSSSFSQLQHSVRFELLLLLKWLCTSYRKYATIVDIFGRSWFSSFASSTVTILPFPLLIFITDGVCCASSVHIILLSFTLFQSCLPPIRLFSSHCSYFYRQFFVHCIWIEIVFSPLHINCYHLIGNISSNTNLKCFVHMADG